MHSETKHALEHTRLQRLPHTALSRVRVSHAFPYKGGFLHRRPPIKHRAVFHNFCQMTQRYVILMLFQLESTAWHERRPAARRGVCHAANFLTFVLDWARLPQLGGGGAEVLELIDDIRG